MDKFKLGDRVRIVKDYPGFDKDCEQSTVGKIGIIKGFHDDGDPKVFFEDIDDFWYYKDECLELVSDDTSPKYTYADVIIDPNDPRVEIGAEYYFADTPQECVGEANFIKSANRLSEVKNEKLPFFEDYTPWLCMIRKKEPTYTERQAQWVMANNIKVGDYVKITRIATTYENGWGKVWNDSRMNHLVNKVCKIVDIHDRYGISLNLGSCYFWVPYFVLAKVNKPEFNVGDFVREKDTALVGVVVMKTEEGLLSVYQNVPEAVLLFSEDELEHVKAHLEPFDLKREFHRNKLRGKWVSPKYKGEDWKESLISGFVIEEDQELLHISNYGETNAQTLLEAFCFLDGSPCGLVVEDE